MKTLHILRRRNDYLAEAAICSESLSGGNGDSVSVLLIQDAVLGVPSVPGPVYVDTQDLQARGVARSFGDSEGTALKHPQIIDYEDICQMILDHDRTVVW